MPDSLELLRQLRTQAERVPHRDVSALDALRRRADMIIRNVFGAESKYLIEASNISFITFPSSDSAQSRAWVEGNQAFLNLIDTMIEEVTLFGLTEQPRVAEEGTSEVGDEIFVVHGHDDAMKESVARTIGTLGLKPIILHEQPNEGRTIIEKFTDHAQVGFAVVALSGDDMARLRSDPPGAERPRARQNVIFELGYFVGRLGRARVIALFREEPGFEIPSDYSGVAFVPFDSRGRWQFDLIKELRSAGYAVDANRLV